MRTAILATFLCLMAIDLAAIPTTAQAQTVNDVRDALGDLQRWVESDPVRGNELWAGEGGWRDYLKGRELNQALLLYPHGDREALEFPLRQLEGKGDSLALPIPQRLRAALKGLLAPPSNVELSRIEARLREALEQVPNVDPKQQLELAKHHVTAAIEKTEALFAKWPEANRAGWREYLRWPLLKEELHADHVPNVLRLRKIRRLLMRNHDGLERVEFRQLADAIRKLIDITNFYELHFPLAVDSADENEPAGRTALPIDEEEGSSDEAEDEVPGDETETQPKTAEGERVRKAVPPQDVYRQIVTSLLHRVADGDRRGDGRQNGELNYDLTMGNQYPQLKQIVEDVRKDLSQSSLHVSATESFISELGTLPIDQSMQVQETILGAQMSGTSRAVGKTSVRLTADPNRISADYLLNSKVYSQNTGIRGKIVACSTSTADVTGIIKAQIDLTGLTVGAPSISADTNTNIDSVRANTIFPNLVSRIATRAAHKQLPQAEYEASRKTEQRISREFGKQADERVAKINKVFREKITPFLARREDIKGLHLHSTDVSAHASGRIADVWQVSTDASPPPHHLSGPVIARVHESLVNNWLETELAGNILQIRRDDWTKEAIDAQEENVDFAEILGLKGAHKRYCEGDEDCCPDGANCKQRPRDETKTEEEAGEETLLPGELPRNSMQLASKCPIALSFDRDKVRVQAVIDRLRTEKGRRLDSALEVSAVYRISRGSGTIELDRIGKVQVNYFDPKKNAFRTGSDESTAKTMLQKEVTCKVLRCKFDVTEIVDRIVDRVVGKNTTMFSRLRDYQVTNVESEGGWLSLSLDRKATPAVPRTGTPTLAPVLGSPSLLGPPSKVSP